MKGSATTKDLGNELATKSPATKRNTEIVLRAHNYALHSVVLIQDLFTRTVKHISTIQSTIYAKLKLWLRLYFCPDLDSGDAYRRSLASGVVVAVGVGVSAAVAFWVGVVVYVSFWFMWPTCCGKATFLVW